MGQHHGCGPSAYRRDIADPWRHIGHRQSCHPDVRRARPSHFHHRRLDQKCEAALRFGAARAINYRTEDFVAVVKEETNGKGVDVILDMVGGSYIQRNIEAAAPWGRIVNIAYQESFKAEVNFAPVLTKRLTLAATTLRGRTPAQKQAIRDSLGQKVWPLLGTRVKPVIDRTFPLAEAGQAHDFMAKTGHVGKILLTLV